MRRPSTADCKRTWDSERVDGMAPTDEFGGVRLFNADCLDVLRSLPDGCVDAVVTDPPFGIGFKYSSHDDTPEGYGEWLWSVLLECERLCKPGSPLFVWQAMKNVRRFAEWFPRDFRLFAAAKNFVQIRPNAMQYAFDPVVVWWTEGERWVGGQTRDFHVANIASVVTNRRNIEKGHPCPRPLDQIRYVVRNWCRPGGVVLDPFAGSGTTGAAAAREGRSAVLVEKDPDYYALCLRRLRHADGAGSLFDPKQLTITEGY